jgi:hypothetical protein
LLEEDSTTRQVSARFFRQTNKMRGKALGELDRLKVPLLVIYGSAQETEIYVR